MRAIVIGGGIGGLTAAIALRRVGVDVAVFERAVEPKEVGAGIGLWGNAVGALRRVELAEAVLARGEVMKVAEVTLASGRRLMSLSGAEFARVGMEPVALVHRAELLEELLKALPREAVRFGKTFARFEQDAHGVTAHFEDGTAERGDVLIGADGLNSRTRAEIVGDGAARYAGYTCWRGVTMFPYERVAPGYVGEFWGRGARFGITRIGGERVYWWATLNAPVSPMAQGALDREAKATLLKSHGGFCAPIPELIEATDAAKIVRNDLYDRAPTRRWFDGRAIVIGDAAHPTTPNIGQGGCMAIEDGVRLAMFLDGVDGADGAALASAFAAFVRKRHAKTAATVRESWWFGFIGQWENSVMRWGRDRVMSGIGAVGMRRAVRRIGVFEE